MGYLKSPQINYQIVNILVLIRLLFFKKKSVLFKLFSMKGYAFY